MSQAPKHTNCWIQIVFDSYLLIWCVKPLACCICMCVGIPKSLGQPCQAASTLLCHRSNLSNPQNRMRQHSPVSTVSLLSPYDSCKQTGHYRTSSIHTSKFRTCYTHPKYLLPLAHSTITTFPLPCPVLITLSSHTLLNKSH